MNTGSLLAADLAVTVLLAAAWLGGGAAAAAQRPRLALALLGVAVLAAAARAASLATLARAGWWFVEEKLLIGAPLAAAGAVAAVAVAGPRLLAAARGAGGGSPAAVVALFSAGYASAAGPLVTALHGYPATVSSALLAAATAVLASLATWRIVARPASGVVLRGGLAAALVAAFVGVGLGAVPGTAAGVPHEHQGGMPAVTDLRGPATPAAGGTVRRYALTAATTSVTLPSGRRVAAWAFNGQVPGPALTATAGDLLEVTLRNTDIETGVTLHWHGYDVPAGEDGVPGLTQEAVAPGREFVYRFRADQVGTYWYHTHSVSDRGVRMGLYGTLVVTPRPASAAGLDLTVPVHTLSGSVLVGDRDRLGEQAAAPGTPVRLRLINTDSTPHRFALAGTVFRVAAIDGGDLTRPGELREVAVRLPAGGRYDLTFVMPDAAVTLVVDDAGDRGLRLRPAAAAEAPIPRTADWPVLDPLSYGTPQPTPFDAHSRFDRDYTLVLGRGLDLAGGRPRYAHTVNGRAAPDIPVQVVREGDLVRFTIVNGSLAIHPWHLHGHHVLVLSRDGKASTGSPLWLDSIDVLPGEVWQVAFLANNPGVWANHCHNLPHAEAGMMLHLTYEGVGTPFGGIHR